jgi:hypothetical protein
LNESAAASVATPATKTATAWALGLTEPPALSVRGGEVIECYGAMSAIGSTKRITTHVRDRVAIGGKATSWG